EEGKSLYRTFLVSNRHVFENQRFIVVRQNRLADEPAEEIAVDLEVPGGGWTGHPDNDIDVAVMPVNTNYLRDHGLTQSFFHANTHALRRQQMADAGVSEGDAAFVLGFPMGLAGEKRNYVVVRSAGVARI